MMATEEKKLRKVSTFFRMIKAGYGHPFAGLYAVEKLRYKGTDLIKSEIVHEWDLRIISESILARLGGQDAFENFKEEYEVEEPEMECATPAAPRTPEEIADLSVKKLKSEYVKPQKGLKG